MPSARTAAVVASSARRARERRAMTRSVSSCARSAGASADRVRIPLVGRAATVVPGRLRPGPMRNRHPPVSGALPIAPAGRHRKGETREPPGVEWLPSAAALHARRVSADAIDHAVPVGKLQVVVARGLPAASRMAPVRVAVNLVLAGRGALGFSVATRVVALSPPPAALAAPVVAFFSVTVVPETPVPASLKVAVTFAVRLTPTA